MLNHTHGPQNCVWSFLRLLLKLSWQLSLLARPSTYWFLRGPWLALLCVCTKAGKDTGYGLSPSTWYYYYMNQCLYTKAYKKCLVFPADLLELQVSTLAQHADSFLTNLFMTRLCFSSPSWFCSFLLLFWFLFIAYLLFSDIFALVEDSLFRHKLSIQSSALVAFSNTEKF